MIRSISVLLFVIGFIFQSCNETKNENNTVSLGLKFGAGANYVYLMDTRQTIEQQMSGINSEISQHMKLQSSYKVEAAPDNNSRLTVNYDRFYIKSSSNGLEMEYDSEDSTKQPAELAGAGAIVNHPFSIVVNSKGEILKVESGDQSGGNMQSQFSDSSIRQMMEQSLNIYPEKPVKTGDTWQRTYTTAMGFMEMQVVSDYKLISVANNVAHIEIKAAIKSKAQSNKQTEGMQIEMNGTQNGTMDIDVNTGLIQDSRFTQNVKGKMIIPGAEIPMTLVSDTRIIGRMR
ncbi:MAG TPA: DUF6263 family protein [Flavipsychrobacter sp.]|nr:DUF6263 family protein [Flavipsychrobacter sp.]